MVISDDIKTGLPLSESDSDLSGQTSRYFQHGYQSRHNSDCARFEAKIRLQDGHWLWTGSHSGTGGMYGQFWYDREKIGAHVAAWLIYRGEIPAGQEICHQCPFKLCVNPDHLSLGTHTENLRQAVAEHGTWGGAPNKLTAERAAEIRALLAAGKRQREVAAMYSVSQVTISMVARYKTWRPGARRTVAA